MKTVACYSIKGGVGKTATAVNLAYCSAALGKRTLLIDLDPQGASSFYFRVKEIKQKNWKSLFAPKSNLLENIKASDYEHLHILPASLSYRNLDITFSTMKRSSTRLAKAIASLKKEYDLVFLDCPPGISLVSENVFNAADVILVPVIPTELSVRTFEQLLNFLEHENDAKKKVWPFFSMVQSNNRMHRETMERMKRKYPLFLDNIIPLSADIERMGENRQPVLEDKDSKRGAPAYRMFWAEVSEILLG